MDVAQEILRLQDGTLSTSMNRLMACRVCAQIKTSDQFEQFGCSNCTQSEPMVWNVGSYAQMTTSSFSGVISMLKPTESWVSKWQLMKKNYLPGLYAIEVTDRLTAQEAQAEESGDV